MLVMVNLLLWEVLTERHEQSLSIRTEFSVLLPLSAGPHECTKNNWLLAHLKFGKLCLLSLARSSCAVDLRPSMGNGESSPRSYGQQIRFSDGYGERGNFDREPPVTARYTQSTNVTQGSSTSIPDNFSSLDQVIYHRHCWSTSR